MAAPAQPRVSLIFPSQYAEGAVVLGRAFVDDPLIKAIMPPLADADERARRFGALFGVVLRGHRGDGQPVFGVMHQGRVGAAAVVEQVAQAASAAAVWLHGLPLLPSLLRSEEHTSELQSRGHLVCRL